jgi:hypothetical protein
MAETLDVLLEKWDGVINSDKATKIESNYKQKVTAQLLENTESFLTEATPTNVAGGMDNYDPILISLVRRMAPKLIAYDIAGLQPMNGPTGLIFALRARYTDQVGAEAGVDEADTAHSGAGTHAGTDPFGAYTTGTGMPTATAEGDTWAEMAFTIEKSTVSAESRQLKASYSLELAQDLKAIHGLDADTELTNILSTELISEINRHVIRTVYGIAKPGAAFASTPGTFDLATDSDGRWSVEKFKGLIYAIERDANAIAVDTRRGKGNIILCSADVASAMALAGVLDYNPALATNLDVDPAGATFAGTYRGRFKVYVDPYVTSDFYVVGYKGANQYDAGMFYCPYVPLQQVRATDQTSFQPSVGFKTRYGMVSNPFTSMSADSNAYYRKVKVTNLL